MQHGLSSSRLCSRYLSTALKSHKNQSRYSSSTQPTFSSFFFHNAQWTGTNNHTQTTRLRKSIAELAHRPIPASNPPVPLSSYREIEPHTPVKLLKIYNQLSKSNLTILVVLTSMSGVALSPLPTTLPILLSTALGTVLCSASANTLNQLQEVPFDAQMARTRMRPFVRRALSPLHGLGFAITTGVAGPALLWAMTNTTTACLGLANIVLYAGVYTWMKRRTVWNTWVGSVIGAIPPLMGWTAGGGQLLPTSLTPVTLSLPPFLTDGATAAVAAAGDNPLAPAAFFMLLFSWQFFHFMPLSHLVRHSYAQAGYQMLAVLDPRKNALVALRHTALLVPVCSLLFPLAGLTTWVFAATTLIPNLVCARTAWAFWRHGGEREARRLFQHSLWYLPVVMGLMMVHKEGVDWLEWIGLTKAVVE
ncbi:hypothetical protein HYPSUDRAFT_129899 [Hypholoma sublateritium FD-334 SS-4]|uniref:Protoheme IX farnesyltransferase, mitochondrial n=1 Tax=Hypholoma sublateritium (strain FD-334 SS-4) TaxID=945553 RepID=A0A0D2PBN3_HYPSF|nr:hypothetical protein HYPSUDRAFT_129899 [Hypholoma sublateritium FD-334 SS-4]